MANRKQQILELTDGGFNFFEYVIEDLEWINEERCKNVLNPFYDDKKPGFSVYRKDGICRFCDFGEPQYSGDVFDFAALHYDLDVKNDFPEILSKIIIDLNLIIDITPDSEYDSLQGAPFKLNPIGEDNGLADAYEYYSQFGISKEVLKEFKVKAISSCIYLKKGEIVTYKKGHSKLLIAYDMDAFIKIYDPGAKKFCYLPSRSNNYPFGYWRILYRNTRCKRNREFLPPDVLIITGGEKDVMTLTSLGYDAVCLNSETASLPPILNTLVSDYSHVIVLYDNDSTGVQSAQRLATKNAYIKIATLPSILKDNGGKDVSDYMKLKLPVEELHIAIKNAATIANMNIENETSDVQNYIDDDNPLIPLEVYENLPQLLKEYTDLFDDRRDKDIVFLSALAVLGSCFPFVEGIYKGQRTCLNLFLFVIAPPSAGKGVMMFSKHLGMEIQRHLGEVYKAKMKDYREMSSENKKNAEEPPKKQVLFIPANNSTSMLIELMSYNESFGVLFDTEADTLTQSTKADWGNFTDVLRKIFQNEPVELARRANNEFIQIDKSCLSVVLSGTPNQLPSLIASVENGFFSRFLYYQFSSEVIWKNTFREKDRYIADKVKDLAKRLRKIWIEGSGLDSNILVDLTVKQQDSFASFFTIKQSELYDNFGDDIIPSIRRLALICYRIAMILTVLRKYQEDKWSDNLLVSDQDFETSIKIIDTLCVHLGQVFTSMKIGHRLSSLNAQQNQFYTALPLIFSRNEADRLAESNGIKFKTCEKYLKDFKNKGLLVQPKHGEYIKC